MIGDLSGGAALRADEMDSELGLVGALARADGLRTSEVGEGVDRTAAASEGELDIDRRAFADGVRVAVAGLAMVSAREFMG